MSTSRLVTIERLRQLANRIKHDQSIDTWQKYALGSAILALEMPVTIDWEKRCVHHHTLIGIELR